ncbi:MAG TPA: hypothetical protein VKG44_05635 [Candidatus Baltobacteraceae bacterium]|nr:hypothetical protein [Candidatus Baltobacteraceae bacterium]
MNTELIECSHQLCQCTVTAVINDADADEAYCSDFCREAEMDEGETICACGHPPCDS